MSAHTVVLDELFLSLQGEAGEVGRPHLFVRLGGCPLRCAYCDTPRSWRARPEGELHLPGATRRFANPVATAELDALLAELAAAHGVRVDELVLAVTGGEPLEQAEFLAAWLPRAGAPALLETAGVLPARLEALLPHLRYVSLDVKDPEDLRAGAEQLAPLACLDAVVRHREGRSMDDPLDFWLKFVLTETTRDEWLAARLAEVAGCAPGARVFLQPVTPRASGPAGPAPDVPLRHALAARTLPLDLRVLPQVHPLLAVR